MQYPATLTAEIKNVDEHKAFNSLVEKLQGRLDEKSPESKVLSTAVFRPADETKQARVRISGQEIAQGTRTQMKQRYDQEYAMHPQARIVLEEMVNDGWKLVRGTRRVH